MIRSLTLCCAAFGCLLFAEPAAACTPDYWGLRATAIVASGKLEITLHSQTQIVHPSNHFPCEDAISVRVELWGGATCNSGTVSKNHSWFGTNTSADVMKVCSNLQYDTAYTGHGFHNAMGWDEEMSYDEDVFIWYRSEDDLDGDGYSPDQGDCNDEPSEGGNEFYPGASPPWCGSEEFPTGYDYNCDGIDDATQLSEVCPNSPIVIDMDGDGFELTNRAQGVAFDLNNDGTAEWLPWTARLSDDVWLALDRNRNGLIDNGSELFGNYTPQPPSQVRNGFLALAAFDQRANGGNEDGVIDPRDSIYLRLLVWRDANHDGRSQPLELNGLAVAGIGRISLDYHETRRQDQWGNWFRFRAKVGDLPLSSIGRWAYDVFLAGRPPHTRR